jgi:hypothetical protein
MDVVHMIRAAIVEAAGSPGRRYHRRPQRGGIGVSVLRVVGLEQGTGLPCSRARTSNPSRSAGGVLLVNSYGRARGLWDYGCENPSRVLCTAASIVYRCASQGRQRSHQ